MRAGLMRTVCRWAARAGCVATGFGALAGCAESEPPDDATGAAGGAPVARLVPASEAIDGAYVPTLDPMTMVDAEIREVLGEGPHCAFRYTRVSRPALAFLPEPGDGRAAGTVKVNGHLVALERASADGGLTLSAREIRLILTPDGEAPIDVADDRDAELVFEVGTDLSAGYRGVYSCGDSNRSS